jgi:putative glutamine amidotransferase
MHKKIKIGITLRVVSSQNYFEKRDALSQEWPILLEKLGLIPIFIPNSLSNVDDFIIQNDITGIILSGGDDIGSHKERDETENNLLNYSIQHKLPVLGVCRGMQVLNTHFGGKISKNRSFNHVGTPHSLKLTHKLFPFLDSSFTVNSFHNNIIEKNELGDEIESFAISEKDETVEGFFHKTLPIIGVMWHPERQTDEINEKLIADIFINGYMINKK